MYVPERDANHTITFSRAQHARSRLVPASRVDGSTRNAYSDLINAYDVVSDLSRDTNFEEVSPVAVALAPDSPVRSQPLPLAEAALLEELLEEDDEDNEEDDEEDDDAIVRTTSNASAVLTYLQVLERLFAAADVDSSGAIDADELRDVLAKFYKKADLKCSEEEMKAEIASMMAKYDSDHSGTLDFSEFTAMYTSATGKSQEGGVIQGGITTWQYNLLRQAVNTEVLISWSDCFCAADQRSVQVLNGLEKVATGLAQQTSTSKMPICISKTEERAIQVPQVIMA